MYIAQTQRTIVQQAMILYGLISCRRRVIVIQRSVNARSYLFYSHWNKRGEKKLTKAMILEKGIFQIYRDGEIETETQR